MPDLSIEIMQQCSQMHEGFNIGGYQQVGIGTEQPSCTCKGFQFHGYCKHIKQAQEEMCSYHQLTHGRPKVNGICPLCGAPTEYVKVAV
jgi:hypothetical protein